MVFNLEPEQIFFLISEKYTIDNFRYYSFLSVILYQYLQQKPELNSFLILYIIFTTIGKIINTVTIQNFILLLYINWFDIRNKKFVVEYQTEQNQISVDRSDWL